MKNNVYKSAAQVTAFSTVEKTLSFFYRIILTRIIGAEGLGVYQICLTMFAVFLTIASSGIPITVSRLMAKNNAKGDLTGRHAAVTAGVVCTLAVTIPTVIILFTCRKAFGFLFSDERCMPIFLIILPGLILTSVYAVIRGSFWGNKQFIPYSVIELLEDAVMVIVGTALVFTCSDPITGATYAAVAVLVSYVFSFTVSLIWYFKSGGKFVNPKKQLKPLISSSAPITAMRTSTSLINSAVAVILPALLIKCCNLSGSEAISLYGVVAGMAVPMLFIPNSFIGSIAVVVAPELSENYYGGRAAGVKYDVEKSVKASAIIATFLVPVLFVLGGAVSEFLYANELCGKIVRISAFIVFPLCITMMTNTILNSMNCEKRTLLYFGIGAAAMILSIVLLTKYLGVYSYIVGLALDNLIVASLNLRLLKKKCPSAEYIRYILVCLAVIGVSILFGCLLNGLVSRYLAPLWQICICAPLIMLFCGGALCVLGMISAAPVKKLFAKKNKAR